MVCGLVRNVFHVPKLFPILLPQEQVLWISGGKNEEEGDFPTIKFTADFVCLIETPHLETLNIAISYWNDLFLLTQIETHKKYLLYA